MKFAALIPIAEDEDTFDSFANRPMSEKRLALRIGPTQARSSAKLENAMREQIASIPVSVEYAVLRLFCDAGCATESSSDTKVLSVIRTVVNTSVVKDFQSAASYTAVQWAVHTAECASSVVFAAKTTARSDFVLTTEG